MKCPHCLVEFHATVHHVGLPNDKNGMWYLQIFLCASCKRNIVYLINGDWARLPNSTYNYGPELSGVMVYPKGSTRPPVPVEVPNNIAVDYSEACLVVHDSSKASAALSRRCLQNLLLEKAGVAKGDLSKQIQEVIDSGKLPSHISEDIDAIRNIGNFAAHPNKSLTTGAILEVEPHEAEWNLDVLESLFDFYYVQPARAKVRKAALNAKLSDSGKPPMK